MEKIIIIGLVIIIVLLLLDKKLSIPNPRKKRTDKWLDAPSVMGETKKPDRPLMPYASHQRQEASEIVSRDKFDPETTEEIFDRYDQKKNIEDILDKNNAWEEEEEDWQYQELSETESGFATGVTFDELSTAGHILQQDVLEPVLEQQAVNIIQKIHGTELFSLLENSLGDASKKIADLLNKSMPNADAVITSNHKNDAEGFDIGEFV
ncbi:hypothetical protein LUD75_12790 [Epilithonimonas sp. JDS]|jgi:hypothetical protein|uniref:hypothetical protein n=1 Tax=Epilithonimonas sp. JDS TaxID=2902797 RepID=UPI001E2A15D0|nr:hypothetical protein [Epilithonimonas sp. JDS]MCD9855594.1 hypothetical protein [Epilithonimonas sp. JDS]